MLMFYDEFKTTKCCTMTLSLLNLPIFTPGCGGWGGGWLFYPNIKHCNNIIRIYRKHFQHFKTTQGYFSVWKKVVVLPRNGVIFPNKEKKWLDYRCREAKEMLTLGRCFFWGGGYVHAWCWLSQYDDYATISRNNENRYSLRASYPFKRYRVK